MLYWAEKPTCVHTHRHTRTHGDAGCDLVDLERQGGRLPLEGGDIFIDALHSDAYRQVRGTRAGCFKAEGAKEEICHSFIHAEMILSLTQE